MTNALTRSSVVGSNKPIATVTREGLEVTLAPIREYVILTGTAIGAGTAYQFNFTDIDYPIELKSILFSDTNANNTYLLQVESNGTELYRCSTTDVNQPWEFNNLIIEPSQTVILTPTNAINNFRIITQQALILDTISI